MQRILEGIDTVVRAAKETFFATALHGFMRFNPHQKGGLENPLVIVTFGDLLGVPIMPPHYALCLVPYSISRWKPGFGASCRRGISPTL